MIILISDYIAQSDTQYKQKTMIPELSTDVQWPNYILLIGVKNLYLYFGEDFGIIWKIPPSTYSIETHTSYQDRKITWRRWK